MSNKACPPRNFIFLFFYFLNVMFQFRISTETPLFHRKILKYDYSTLIKSRIWGAAGAPKSFQYGCQNLFIYLDYSETPVLSCAFSKKYRCFSSEILAVTKTTSKYIAGLQDPFKDKFVNGKSNYELKSLKINPSNNSYNVCK